MARSVVYLLYTLYLPVPWYGSMLISIALWLVGGTAAIEQQIVLRY